jgi:hypothetical protein
MALHKDFPKSPYAILDRVIHNAYRLTLTGDSQRKTRAARSARPIIWYNFSPYTIGPGNCWNWQTGVT